MNADAWPLFSAPRILIRIISAMSASTSRVSYGLSRNGYFPKAFEWTTKQGVPWVGLIVAFVVGPIAIGAVLLVIGIWLLTEATGIL